MLSELYTSPNPTFDSYATNQWLLKEMEAFESELQELEEEKFLQSMFQDLNLDELDLDELDLDDARLVELRKSNDEFYTTKSYLQSMAKTKNFHMWKRITKDQHTGKFPNTLEAAQLFTFDMNATFDTIGDTLKGLAFRNRPKLIHSVGVVGQVQFVPNRNAHHFSGMFLGADFGIVRLSSAAKPKKGGQPLAPGMGLKFLRNGRDSANLVSMFSVEGQPGNWDFFANDFTTHIAPAHSSTLQKVAWKFSAATDFIQMCGLSDWGRYDQNGHATDKKHFAFPFKLIFKPHADVKGKISSSHHGDMAYLDDLKGIAADSNLYDVYAWDKPQQLGGHEVNIGQLKLRGKMVTSKWGDQDLFFRHERNDDVLKYHPEWEPYSPRYSLDGKCPFQKMLEWL